MRAVHVDSQGEILNLELITVEKERAIKAEARVKELERINLNPLEEVERLEARNKELEDREFNRVEQEGRDLDLQRLLI